MKIGFYRTKLDEKNQVIIDKSVKWYAMTISCAYKTNNLGGRIIKDSSLSGRILSSTRNVVEAKNFSDEETAIVQAFYSIDENRINHQIMLDNP